MSEMVERCVKAGCETSSEFARWGTEEQAELVLAIVKAMREPAITMKVAAPVDEYAQAGDVWRAMIDAMIDAALSEKTA